MRGNDQRSPQEGKGSRTASYAVHTPPIHAFFSLFSCPYKISQQSHSYTPLTSKRGELRNCIGKMILIEIIACQNLTPTRAPTGRFIGNVLVSRRGEGGGAGLGGPLWVPRPGDDEGPAVPLPTRLPTKPTCVSLVGARASRLHAGPCSQ